MVVHNPSHSLIQLQGHLVFDWLGSLLLCYQERPRKSPMLALHLSPLLPIKAKHLTCWYFFELKQWPTTNSVLFPTNSFLPVTAHLPVDLWMLTKKLDSFVTLLLLSTPKSSAPFQESSLSRFPLTCFFLPSRFKSGILHPKPLQAPPAIFSPPGPSLPVT